MATPDHGVKTMSVARCRADGCNREDVVPCVSCTHKACEQHRHSFQDFPDEDEIHKCNCCWDRETAWAAEGGGFGKMVILKGSTCVAQPAKTDPVKIKSIPLWTMTPGGTNGVSVRTGEGPRPARSIGRCALG